MKTRRLLTAAVIVATMALSAASTRAQNAKTSFLDAKSAGPDFGVQGEYVGTIGKQRKLGIQVIALGKGNFDAVLYAGGLPGAGWDAKTRTKLKGQTADGKVTFKGRNFTGGVADGVFSGTAEDDVVYTAKKVIRKSPTLDAKPPAGAVVLFDGSTAEHFQGGKLQAGKLLNVGVRSKQKFGSFTLHLEFRIPFMPYARGQGRGNSGMYLQDQYECQVLDSFGLAGLDNECGGIYKVARPKVNMCLPPLSWQTYDVEFTTAKFDKAGKKLAPAVTTIRHNGVVIHEKLKLKLTAGGGQSNEKPGSLFLQNHGDPVRFRNIWVVETR
jgi:hypothetical protein